MLTQWIPAAGVHVQITMLEESVHETECGVTAQLKQELPGIIYVSITTVANPHLSTSASFWTCALKSPKKIVDNLALPFAEQDYIISSTKSRDYALDFGSACLHQREHNLNMHTLPPSGIHSLTQLASKGLQVSPLQPGQTLLAQHLNRSLHLSSSCTVSYQQHSGNIVWPSWPVHALLLEVKRCPSFQLLTYNKIVV